MIKTKSVRFDVPEESDGFRLLVMRFWPRGKGTDGQSISYKHARIDMWWKALSPSAELVHAYHHGTINWDTFAKRYRQEMQQQGEWLDKVRELEHVHGTVTLLCYEPEGEHCHRYVLKALLEEQHNIARLRIQVSIELICMSKS